MGRRRKGMRAGGMARRALEFDKPLSDAIRQKRFDAMLTSLRKWFDKKLRQAGLRR